MLRYFRINDPYRLLGLLVLMTLLSLPLFIDTTPLSYPELRSFVIGEKVHEGHTLYSELIDRTPPLASWLYGLGDILFGRSLTLRHLLAFLILFLQSAFLGVMLIDKKVFSENTYIPSFIFSILAFISFDSISLTADLLASGFILLTLNNLFKEIEFRIQRDETIFNLGLFLSLASLLRFSHIIYLPGAILVLLIFTRSNFRKYLLMLSGFLLPHLFLICVYYLTGNFQSLWQYFYLPNFSFGSGSLISSTSLLLLCAIPLLYLFISLFILNRDAHLTKYQSQIFQATFLWFAVALIEVLFTSDRRPQSLITLLPPVSFFLTHYFLLIRRRRLAEIHLWVLLIGVVTVAYLARYNKIEKIQYDKLVVKQVELPVKSKRILVLDNQPELFTDNQLATSFYEWNVFKPVFTEPNYYDNLLLVSRSFEDDLPEIIIDPKNLMEAFFERLPALAAQYERTPEGYQLVKVSN
ncbi:MAG TPA: DUF6427 family protein [Cyclobacteriaceae bacterium]|nr:DUF6427 family protein [Cyclobacteriaceae bacterium]